MGITSDLSIPSYSGASDDTLLDALRGGDEHAFSELVHRYHATLVRVAMAYVGSRDRAEDVAQEAWLGMLRGIGQFAGRSSLRTWLFRILINCAHADCRRRGRAIVFADLRDDTDEGDAIIEPDRFHPAGHRWADHWSIPPQEWPEACMLSAEIGDRLIEAMRHLPERQRVILTLRDVEGWPQHEICEMLGISEANARVLLHRVRTQVRRELERYLARSEEEFRP